MSTDSESKTNTTSALGCATRIKICCIASLEEARLAVSHGASAVGFVSAMPSGPGVIAESQIAEIAPWVPPGVSTFLLTRETQASAIVEQQRHCGCSVLQLVDRVDAEDHERLRDALPGIRRVQVIHVLGEESVAEAMEMAPWVDAILLDSGNPHLPVQELGGTGRVHDWSLSRRICEAIDVPLFLAGGLRPDNVEEAIETVRPYGVDVCSGLRSEGRLDPAKLRAFVEVVRRADAR